MTKVNYYQLMILNALNLRRKHVYSGTVDPAEVVRRRKASKMARKSRQKNRRK